jgi:hypothetical protein
MIMVAARAPSRSFCFAAASFIEVATFSALVFAVSIAVSDSLDASC